MIFNRDTLTQAHFDGPCAALSWHIVKNEHEAHTPDEALRRIQIARQRIWFTYDNERRNCDEFAEALRYLVWKHTGWRGIGYVIDYDGQHCYNVALCHDGKKPLFRLVEPQTGQFVVAGAQTYPGSPESYHLQRGALIL